MKFNFDLLVEDLLKGNGKLIVIFPGGFHPFHKGHKSVYDSIKRKFPEADAYIAISDFTKDRPFTAEEKKLIISSTGIDPNVVKVVKSPLRSEEVLKQYDPEKDRVIFARSQKDKGDPELKSLFTRVKKDGSPSYFQDFKEGQELMPFNKHGYIYLFPTRSFNVLGYNFESASQLRELYKNLSEEDKIKLLNGLYSKNIDKIKRIFDSRLT
jgi:cytidyltransferase-like protein